MTQQRVYNFGDTLTQGRTKTVAAKLLSPGVYEGLSPVLTSPDTINLNPGSFLLPNGVLVSESTPITEIGYPSSGWVGGTGDFTLTADHDDIQAIGGSPVSYTVRPGLLPRFGSPNANSLSLLWIRRQGPLTTAALSVPLPVKNGAVLEGVTLSNGWKQAPFPEATDVVAGANIQQQAVSFRTGPQNTGLLVTNSGAGTQWLQFTLPIPRLPWVRRVEVYADIPNLGSIGFNTFAPTLTGGVAAGTAVLANVTSTSGYLAGDRVTLFDPSTLNTEVAVVQQIMSATQFKFVQLQLPYTVGSLVESLSVVTDEAGNTVPSTPSSIAGPVSGLGGTPAGTFVLSPSAAKPATIGVKIVVPPGATNGVFLKGFQFLGD